MKNLTFEQIADALSELIRKKLCSVEPQTVELLRQAAAKERGDAAKWALNAIIENAEIARKNRCFACQDCGLALVFVTLGNEVKLDFDLNDAINEGVRRGYRDARKSAAHPLTRLNTGDNTPAVIHTELTSGDGLTIEWLAKGAGSENMSAVYMLTPSKGEEGIINSVVDCVSKAGANPCPPIILGVGVGGTMDKAAVLSQARASTNDGRVQPRRAHRKARARNFRARKRPEYRRAGFGRRHDLSCRSHGNVPHSYRNVTRRGNGAVPQRPPRQKSSCRIYGEKH